MVTVKDTRKVQRDEWGARTVRDVMESVGTDNSLPPGAMALDVLRRMTRNGRSRLLVRQGDRLVGVVTLRDLLRFFALKTELEGDSEGLEGEPLESIVGARS